MIGNSDYKKVEDMINKGTTTVGIVCQNGIVIATDTRVTMGYFVAHKHGKKVYPIDNHVAMTIAGVVADAQNVVEILKVNAQLFYLDKGRRIPVSAVARLAANMLFSTRGGLIVQSLVGGVDDSGAHIFSIDPFGSVIEETYASTGSGSPVAYGVLEDSYDKNMSIEEGKALVARAVNAAMKRDIGSGDSFDVVTITKQDGYQELSEEEKKALALVAKV